MATFLGVILIATLSAGFCRAQTGTVTFYSPAFSAKTYAKFYLPKSEQPFGGWLFDGPQHLARIRAGRFATFHLSAGEHSFTDEGPTGPSKKPLVINVKNGGQYCVRLFATTHLVLWENQIEGVPCQQAQREAAHMKRIAIKRVEPAVRAEFDQAITFPTESNAQQNSSTQGGKPH